jgi:hypothetical protein
MGPHSTQASSPGDRPWNPVRVAMISLRAARTLEETQHVLAHRHH